MLNKKLKILVTNDDGYRAKGINVLKDLISAYGDVTVIAPYEPQSGKSSSLTLDRPLRLEYMERKAGLNGNSIDTYTLTGTPADCIKMAMNTVFSRDNKPDILVSGINHGSNASIASLYSGTLGAAAEATVYGVPSIGLSINTHNPNADFSPVEYYLETIISKFIQYPPCEGVYLNVNFPNMPAEEIKGIHFASQGKGMWINEYERRIDPHGKPYYWMAGEFLDTETSRYGDHHVVQNGYISIVPHKVDTTDYNEMERMSRDWNL